MHKTRVNVDEMLADGKIDQAEDYMEARRQFFWENGYHIRKLNQAYFAFHGAYADTPGGTAGASEDPVGEAVRNFAFSKLLRWLHLSNKFLGYGLLSSCRMAVRIESANIF